MIMLFFYSSEKYKINKIWEVLEDSRDWSVPGENENAAPQALSKVKDDDDENEEQVEDEDENENDSDMDDDRDNNEEDEGDTDKRFKIRQTRYEMESSKKPTRYIVYFHETVIFH